MRLWTLQTARWLEVLRADGRIAGDWRLTDEAFRPAYRWMSQRMADRGLDLKSAAPVWAWHSFLGVRTRPDMRVLRQVEPWVCVEIEAPDGLVLLSDYEAWHAVLNNGFLSDNEREDDQIEKRHRGKPPRAVVEHSWPRVFELDGGCPKWRGEPRSRSIQACLPYVELSWMRRIDRGTGFGNGTRSGTPL